MCKRNSMITAYGNLLLLFQWSGYVGDYHEHTARLRR